MMDGYRRESAESEDPRWLLIGDLPCLHCGYNLRGLTGPGLRCPECGTDHDLRDPAPWKLDELPLGIRQRQHWPTAAVACSFFWVPQVVFGILVVSRVADPSVPFCFLLSGVPALAAWLVTTIRWVSSCRDPVWGAKVVIVLHASAHGLLLGALALFGTLGYLLPGPMIRLQALPVLLVAPGLWGFWWTKRALEEADRAGAFKKLARPGSLPLGGDESVPPSSPA